MLPIAGVLPVLPGEYWVPPGGTELAGGKAARFGFGAGATVRLVNLAGKSVRRPGARRLQNGDIEMELRPFDEVMAADFVHRATEAAGVAADNLQEFMERVLELSRGNPGAICSMVKMANSRKYRSGAQIMVTPLYIDFRLNWQAATAR